MNPEFVVVERVEPIPYAYIYEVTPKTCSFTDVDGTISYETHDESEVDSTNAVVDSTGASVLSFAMKDMEASDISARLLFYTTFAAVSARRLDDEL